MPFGMAFWKEPTISTYSEVLNSTIFCCLKFWYKRIVNGCFSILKPERFGCLEGMRPVWAINPTIQKVANSKNERSQLWLNRIYSSHRSASVSRLWSQNILSTLASKTGIIEYMSCAGLFHIFHMNVNIWCHIPLLHQGTLQHMPTHAQKKCGSLRL